MQKIALFAMTILLVLTGSVVRAESATTLTADQLSLIKANCQNTQSILGRVQVSDALMRVNLGQQYESISIKLMAPLNSRISLNNLDGVDLAQTTVDFNRQLDQFRSKYTTYGQTVSSALNMNCSQQPAQFYATVALARTQRADVHAAVGKLNVLVTQYSTQFTKFVTDTLKSAGGK